MKYRGFYIEITPKYTDLKTEKSILTVQTGVYCEVFENEKKLKRISFFTGLIGDNLPYPIPGNPDFMKEAIEDFVMDVINQDFKEYKKCVKKDDDNE